MEKKIIREIVYGDYTVENTFSEDIGWGCKLSDVHKGLLQIQDEVLKKYMCEWVQFSFTRPTWDDDPVEIEVYACRMESDSEYKARIARAEEYRIACDKRRIEEEKQKERQERQLLKELKAKYE